MATIGALIYKLGLDVSELSSNAKSVEGKLSSLGGMAGTAAKALGGMLAIGGVANAVSAYTEFTGRISDLAAKTGMSTTAVQQLSYAAQQSGGNFDQVASGVAQMANRLVEGDKSAVAGLKTMGLSFTQIRQMAPEQAFLAIADGIAKVPNPLEQSKLAMDLFGKSGADLLPMIKNGLSETAAEADKLGLVLSESAIQAGDEFGDTMDKLKLVGMSLISSVLTPLVPLLSVVANAVVWLADKIGKVLNFVIQGTIALGAKMISVLLDLAAAAAELALKYGGPVAKHLGITSATVLGLRAQATHMAAVAQQHLNLATGAEKATAPVKTMAAAIRTTATGAKEATESVDELAIAFRRLDRGITGAIPSLTLFEGQLVGLVSNAKTFKMPNVGWFGQTAEGLQQSGATFAQQWFGGYATGLKDFGSTTKTQLDQGTRASESFRDRFGGALKNTGSVLDGLSRVAEMSGHKTTAAVLSTASSTVMALAVGGPFAAALTFATGLLSSFGKAIFGSENARKDFAATSQIQSLQAQLLSTYGSLEKIDQIGKLVGIDLAAAWGDRSQAGLKHFQDLLDQFNTKVGEQKTKLAELQQQLADRTVMDWEKAQSLIEQYGGTLGNLGQSFEAAKQAANWKSVWDDWQTLIDMGADVGGVLVSMKDEIGTLVSESLRIGTEIPAQFKPLIEELVRSGQLVGEYGVAITDLSTLKFGAPLVSEVDKIVAAIDKLVAALSTNLTGAINGIPRSVEVEVGYKTKFYGTEPPEPSGGAYHTGGLVSSARRAMGATAVPWSSMRLHTGGEVPAWLQSGEYVVSRTGVKALGLATLDAVNTGRIGLAGPREPQRGGDALSDAVVDELRALPVLLSASLNKVIYRTVRDAVTLAR